MSFTTLVSVTPSTSIGATGYTFRVKVPASQLTSNPGATQVRVTFTAPGSTTTTITKAYVGNAATETLVSDSDFQCATFAQLLFSGSAGATISAGTSVVSDTLDVTGLVTVDGSVNLVVSVYVTDNEAEATGLGSSFACAYKASDVAATTGSVSFDGIQSGNWYVTTKIESQAGPIQDSLNQASLTATSYGVTETGIDVLGYATLTITGQPVVDKVTYNDALSYNVLTLTGETLTELIFPHDFLLEAQDAFTGYGVHERLIRAPVHALPAKPPISKPPVLYQVREVLSKLLR